MEVRVQIHKDPKEQKLFAVRHSRDSDLEIDNACPSSSHWCSNNNRIFTIRTILALSAIHDCNHSKRKETVRSREIFPFDGTVEHRKHNVVATAGKCGVVLRWRQAARQFLNGADSLGSPDLFGASWTRTSENQQLGKV
jgi:hypothetical protein